MTLNLKNISGKVAKLTKIATGNLGWPPAGTGISKGRNWGIAFVCQLGFVGRREIMMDN